MMADLLELVSTGIVLATKPLKLCKSICLFGITSACIVIQTWTELLMTSIHVHLTIVWKLIVWTIAILSLPLRLFTTIRRARLLEMHLKDMRIALEDLAWDKKELREQLQVAIQEHKMMEAMLAELEVQHEEAVFKVQQLVAEVHDLKEENRRLKEAQGKIHSERNGGLLYNTEVKQKDIRGEGGKRPSEISETVKAEFIGEAKEVALSRSFFSAVLSLVVGIIVWKAEEPCMPLIVALFAVVLMSLKSVVGFFSTTKNTPAKDAIALLSFNWFILGTLTYPVLPNVAGLLAPLALKLLELVFGSFGVL
ncbi:hypothetical protein LIER_26792 [Lithospermum erythrorhizon]|uniref:Uncharacterized protein n=1 Tax=Lithospermum erythrorhizon TaxID=34254 RepID=A0AAV3R9M6_LITER